MAKTVIKSIGEGRVVPRKGKVVGSSPTTEHQGMH